MIYYRVTRVTDGYSVLSVWPAVYLNSPYEYEVTGPDGRIENLDDLVAADNA